VELAAFITSASPTKMVIEPSQIFTHRFRLWLSLVSCLLPERRVARILELSLGHISYPESMSEFGVIVVAFEYRGAEWRSYYEKL
jgi:hypothetical protein